MKALTLLRTVCLLCCTFVTTRSVGAQENIKLMSYNIRNCTGMDGRIDLNRTAAVILSAAPEVCALQEVDSAARRTGSRDILGELASRTGLHATYARAIAFDGGAYGVGILSKEAPLHVRRVPLPGREEERVALVAEFENYVFICTHLTLTDEDQAASVGILCNIAAEYGLRKPVFLAGDLNFRPNSEHYKALNKGFTPLTDLTQPTFPAPAPEECIDYILGYVNSPFCYQSLSSEVVAEPMTSDHRPITATVRYSPILRTLPYLQSPSYTSITVSWLTNTSAYSYVEYGTDTTALHMARTLIDGQALAGNTINRILLEGLTPGATYYYRIRSQALLFYGGYEKIFGGVERTPFYSFTLPSPTQTDFTAVIVNDLHQNRAATDAICSVLRNKEVEYDFVVFNGDVIDDPASQDQAVATLSYYMEQFGGTQIPSFFLRGNHEIRNAYSIGLRKLLDYMGPTTYGAFSWGDTRFVVLDCGEDKPDNHPVYYDLNDFTGLRADQVNFLKTELAGKAFKQASKRVLIHHIPIYGMREETYNPCQELWHPLLRQARFDVAINGHTHQFAYEPRGGDQGNGVVNNFPVVIGGGPGAAETTVMVLQRRGAALTLIVYKASDGAEFLRLTL